MQRIIYLETVYLVILMVRNVIKSGVGYEIFLPAVQISVISLSINE